MPALSKYSVKGVTLTTPTPQKRSAKAEARRQQIIDVALRLFAENGFAATPTKLIAQEVGVTEGLIFHYFPNKAALLREAALQRSAFIGEAAALLSQAGDLPAREVLGGIVLGWVNVFHQRSDVVVTLLFESQANKGLADTFRGVVDQMVGSLAGYLASRVKAGELRADLPTRTSATMFFSSLVLFLIANEQLEPDDWTVQATAFTDELLDIWLRGALAEPTPTA